MSKTGLIIGKFYPPHKGHSSMFKFAENFMANLGAPYPELNIHCYSKSHYKLNKERADYIESLVTPRISPKFIIDDSLPDYPRNDNDYKFWDTWENAIKKYADKSKFDYVFASEPYGDKLAKTLGAKFIPYDLESKSFLNARDIRDDFAHQYNQIDRKFLLSIMKKFVITGPESAGKTTLIKNLIKEYNDPSFGYEWARPYLTYAGETFGPSSKLLINKFSDIVAAQSSYEMIKFTNTVSPFWIQESDLLTTEFWYRKIYGNNRDNSDITKLKSEYFHNKIYILIDPVNIPFVPDPLRYGGTEREATVDEFKSLFSEMNIFDYRVIAPKNELEAVTLVKSIINCHYNPFKE